MYSHKSPDDVMSSSDKYLSQFTAKSVYLKNMKSKLLYA